MKLESQVISLEIAKKLKELGVKQESLFWWVNTGLGEWILCYRDDAYIDMFTKVSAFTVAELGEMIIKGHIPAFHISTYKDAQQKWWIIIKGERIPESRMFSGDTEADARGLMLIYLLENKLITL